MLLYTNNKSTMDRFLKSEIKMSWERLTTCNRKRETAFFGYVMRKGTLKYVTQREVWERREARKDRETRC